MVSKSKRYRYKKETLQFEVIKPCLLRKTAKVFGFFFKTSLYAAVLLMLTVVTGFSPFALVQQKRIDNYQKKYASVDIELNNLQTKLRAVHFPHDKYYRELLELDSIPIPVRYAGSGGSDPLKNYIGTLDKDMLLAISQKIEAIKKQLQIQQNSYDTISNELILRNKQYKQIPCISPVKPDKYIWLSSYFGSRIDPFTFRRRSHKGLDFVGPKNTEIFATASGTVTLIKHSRRGYGNEVVVTHGYDYSTRYAHLNEILVKKGQKVDIGQLIGLMGNTGRSTGTHLHYEVRLNERPINPIYYYADDLSPEEYELLTKRTN